LGGDGKGITAKVAAITVGATAGIGATAAGVATGIISIGISLTAVMGLGLVVLAVGALVYAILTPWTDEQRLAYGQTGAWNDWKKEHTKLLGLAIGAIKAKFGGTDAQVRRLATPYVDGIMAQRNRLSYLAWMKGGPRGIGVSDEYHAQFGHDRGYFWGARGADGNFYDYFKERGEFGYLDPEYLKISTVPIPVGNEVIAPAVVRQEQYQAVNPVIVQAHQTAQRNRASTHSGADTQDVEIPPNIPQTVTLTRTVVVDPVADGCFAQGIIHANVSAYVAHMHSAHGIGQSDNSHAAYGLAHGLFEGSLGPNQALTYKGQVYNWRDYPNA
jgi:hypothetical protein